MILPMEGDAAGVEARQAHGLSEHSGDRKCCRCSRRTGDGSRTSRMRPAAACSTSTCVRSPGPAASGACPRAAAAFRGGRPRSRELLFLQQLPERDGRAVRRRRRFIPRRQAAALVADEHSGRRPSQSRTTFIRTASGSRSSAAGMRTRPPTTRSCSSSISSTTCARSRRGPSNAAHPRHRCKLSPMPSHLGTRGRALRPGFGVRPSCDSRPGTACRGAHRSASSVRCDGKVDRGTAARDEAPAR